MQNGTLSVVGCMETLFPDSVKVVVGGVVVMLFVFNRLAVALPHVNWLQRFRLPEPRISEEERAKRRRRGNRLAAIEMVLAGVILPFGYLASTVMFFNEPGAIAMVAIGVCSLGLIAVGVCVFAKNL